jgi:hypothetical protein
MIVKNVYTDINFLDFTLEMIPHFTKMAFREINEHRVVSLWVEITGTYPDSDKPCHYQYVICEEAGVDLLPLFYGRNAGGHLHIAQSDQCFDFAGMQAALELIEIYEQFQYPYR